MKISCDRVVCNWRSPSDFQMPASSFKDNGHGRRFLSHTTAEFFDAAFAAWGLTDIRPEPMFQNFIGNHFLDGAHTHQHKDYAPEGYAHVRANWMLKKPEFGGNPIIDGEELQVNVGDLWLVIASMESHASTPISGGERLIYSFGALVPIDHVKSKLLINI